MTETAVEPRQGAEVLSPDEAALAAEALGNVKSDELVLPLLKTLQGNSKEVQNGDAEAGEFLNSLTGVSYGEETSLVVFTYYPGRLYSPEDGEPGEEGRTYVAGPEDIVPDRWPEEYAGQRFDELPEAEEVWKRRANDPDDDFAFGSGPPIQTTHNFVGFVVDDPDIPVRLSLKSTSTAAARKINTLLRFQQTPWANVIDLRLDRRTNKRNQPFYAVEADRGRQTTTDERAAAIEMFTQYKSAQVKFQGDEAGGSKADAKAAAQAAAQAAGDSLEV